MLNSRKSQELAHVAGEYADSKIAAKEHLKGERGALYRAFIDGYRFLETAQKAKDKRRRAR